MKTVTNFKYINRNRKIGQYTTLASLAILVIGFIISLTPDPNLFIYSLLALVFGFVLSQVGIYFGNHWGRSPRPDEKLTAGLKGLDSSYTLYNYMTVVPHLLIGPAGIWILAPYLQKGTISYDPVKKRWQQRGGNFLLKIFAQEGLGRPDQDTYSLSQDLQKYISKEVTIPNLPSPQVVMVFVDEKVVLQTPDSPIPAITIDKLKDFIRRQAKENIVKVEANEYSAVDPIKQLQQLLPEDSLTI